MDAAYQNIGVSRSTEFQERAGQLGFPQPDGV